MATTKKDASKNDAPKNDPKDDAPSAAEVAQGGDVRRDVQNDPVALDVPDNTPTPLVPAKDDNKKKGDAPAGYTYVIHPKNGQHCLVDEKSVPELLIDGYLPA